MTTTPRPKPFPHCFYQEQSTVTNKAILSLFQKAIDHIEKFDQCNKKDFILLVDTDKGLVRAFNKRVFSVLGYTPKNLLGKPINAILGDSSISMPAIFESSFQEELSSHNPFNTKIVDITNLTTKKAIPFKMQIEKIEPPQRSIKHYYSTSSSTTNLNGLNSRELIMESMGGYEEEQPYFYVIFKPIKNPHITESRGY